MNRTLKSHKVLLYNQLAPVLLTSLSACFHSNVNNFPKFGYRQFDKFAGGKAQGEIFIQEEHEATLAVPYRSYFLFGSIRDTFPGRMKMGALYVAGSYFEQAFNVWAVPLTGPIAGRMNEVKVYTSDNKILFNQDIYFPKSMELVLPDTLSPRMKIEWIQDKQNQHGLVLELSRPADTTFGMEVLSQDREFFYIPKDEGSITFTQGMYNKAMSYGLDQVRLRIYR